MLIKPQENSSLEQLNEIAPPHSHCIFFFSGLACMFVKTVIPLSWRRRSVHKINKWLVTEPSKILQRIRQISPIMQSHFWKLKGLYYSYFGRTQIGQDCSRLRHTVSLPVRETTAKTKHRHPHMRGAGGLLLISVGQRLPGFIRLTIISAQPRAWHLVLATQLCLTLRDPVDCSLPGYVEFSRQEYWRGLPFPSPGDFPNPGIKPGSPALQVNSLPSEPPGKPDS